MMYTVPFVCVVPQVGLTVQLNETSSLKVSLSIMSAPVSPMVKWPEECRPPVGLDHLRIGKVEDT